MKEEVKKQVKEKDFYFIILNSVEKDNKLPNIDLSKEARNYYISNLKKLNLIKKIGYGTWELTEGGKNKNNWNLIEQGIKKVKKQVKTIGTQDFQSNLHALNIEIPIIEGNLDLVKDFNGYAQQAMKGWTPQYKRILSPLGLTLKNNNNKSVSIYLFSRELPRNVDIMPLIMQSTIYTYDILLKKGVKVDIFQAQTKTLHFSVRNDDLDKVFNKKERFEVILNRDCAKIFENDSPREAKAWVDSSPYLGVETNDLKYKENLIMQPERIERMDFFMSTLREELNPSINKLAEQINLHLAVENRQAQNQELMNAVLNKINDSLGKKETPLHSILKQIYSVLDVLKLKGEISSLSESDKKELEAFLWNISKD